MLWPESWLIPFFKRQKQGVQDFERARQLFSRYEYVRQCAVLGNDQAALIEFASIEKFLGRQRSLQPFLNKIGIGRFAEQLLPWLQRFWAVRSLGGAVDAMLVAQGQADVWIEPNAQPWDLAPLKLLVEEAGGVFKSFTGENTIYGGNAYACAPGLEPCVRELLK